MGSSSRNSGAQSLTPQRFRKNFRPFLRPRSRRPYPSAHPVAREGRSAGDLAAAGCDRAGLSGGADYSPGPGHGALSMPARPGPKHRLAPKTRAHRGLWQNGHAGRQPSSKRYFYFPTPGDGPASRSLPINPHRRALQPVRLTGTEPWPEPARLVPNPSTRWTGSSSRLALKPRRSRCVVCWPRSGAATP